MINKIAKLPNEIQDKIISYTYKFQNKKLIEDIINYNITKKIILEKYYQYWINKIGDLEPEDKYWLVNDIILYLNKNEENNTCYVDNYYHFFRRNYSLNDKKQINNYIFNFYKESANKQVNIFWGLLTPNERIEFIETN
jgi:hypothetical protein